MSSDAPGLQIFAGEESFLVDQAARAAWAEASRGLGNDLNQERLVGPLASAENVEAALRQVAFLDPQRVVWIEDPPDLRRAGAAKPTRSSTRKAPAPGGGERVRRALLEAARPEAPARVILVLHSVLAPGSAFDSQPGVMVRRFARLRRGEVEGWVAQRLQGQELGLPPGQVARHLVNAIGSDLARLAMEAEKVSAAARAGALDLVDLQALVPSEDQAGIFDLCDSMLARDPRQRHQLLVRVLERDEPQAVLAMLARQFRTWLRIAELRAGGVPRSGIAARAGGAPWMAEKAYDRVSGVDPARLQAALVTLANVDWEMKSGRRDSALGLEAAVLSF